MKPHSIRHKLVLSMVASMLLTLGGMGIWALAVTHHEAEEIFSARLATSARVLEALVARQVEKATLEKPLIIDLPHELEQSSSDKPQTFGHSYESKIAFQIWHIAGPLLAHSATAPAQRLGPLVAGFHEHRADGITWQVFALQSGQVWILVAEKEEIRTEMTEDLAKSIFNPLMIGALILLVVAQLVAWFSLRPLGTLARALAERDARTLSPVSLENPPKELAPVVDEINQLLARVRESVEREQGFIDAAAHELRTPIAAIQLHLQNALNCTDATSRQSSMEQALSGVRRAAQMAEQLLVFSRVTAQSNPEPMTPLNLRSLCIEAISLHEPLLSQKGQSIGLDAHSDVWVMGQYRPLLRTLQNLIDNASKYGSPTTDITIKLEQTGHSAHLEVANTGTLINPADKLRLFEPYFRVLGSGQEGSGLGLAIVREIIRQHCGSINVSDLADGQGTVFAIDLPLSDTPPEPRK
jgi:two-component system sensor histidine kinase QseC